MWSPESEFNDVNVDSTIKNIIINTAGIGEQSSEGQQLGSVINGVTRNAIIGMTKHLAKDLSMYDIRVVSVLPGGLKSADKIQAAKYNFANPDDFGYIVQTLVLNGYVNCDAVELNCV